MGLGPPVCMDCLRVMDNRYETYPWWRCTCGKGQGDANVGHLFLLTDAQLEEMDLFWGTDLLATRKRHQEELRRARGTGGE